MFVLFGRATKTDPDDIRPSLWPDPFLENRRGPETIGLGNVGVRPHLARSDCQRGWDKKVYLVVMLDVCVDIGRIGIAYCRQAGRFDLVSERIDLMSQDAATHRFRRFNDAFDDVVPAGRFDDGIVNRGNQIAAAV